MPDESRRRIPGLGFLIAAAILILSIAGVAWWLYRPKGSEAAGGPGLADLDVVCLGRVDGLTPVASLEPSIPGKVAEIYVSEGQPVKPGEKLLKLDDEALRLKEEEARAAFEAAEVDVAAAMLERTLYPFRKAAQEAAVAAAGERVTAAERLLEEKKKSMMFTTVTSGELLANEAELNQLKYLKTAEMSRLDEVKSGLAAIDLKVKAAETKRTMAEIARKQAEKAVRDCVLLAPDERRGLARSDLARRIGASQRYAAAHHLPPRQPLDRPRGARTGVPRPRKAGDEGDRPGRLARRLRDLDRDGASRRQLGGPEEDRAPRSRRGERRADRGMRHRHRRQPGRIARRPADARADRQGRIALPLIASIG